MPDQLEATYTPAEAAELLRVSPETVRALCRDKKIGRIQIGRQYLIPESDFKAYWQRCYEPATT
jgi:excisionase family DNA binding protein